MKDMDRVKERNEFLINISMRPAVCTLLCHRHSNIHTHDACKQKGVNKFSISIWRSTERYYAHVFFLNT